MPSTSAAARSPLLFSALGIVLMQNAEPSGKLTVSVIRAYVERNRALRALFSFLLVRELDSELRGRGRAGTQRRAVCVQRASGAVGPPFHAEHNEDADGNRSVRKPKATASRFRLELLSFNSAAFEYRGGSQRPAGQPMFCRWVGVATIHVWPWWFVRHDLNADSAMSDGPLQTTVPTRERSGIPAVPGREL